MSIVRYGAIFFHTFTCTERSVLYLAIKLWVGVIVALVFCFFFLFFFCFFFVFFFAENYHTNSISLLCIR